jgi:hypothetical protein
MVAVLQTGRGDRVINTQDIFHAALAPARIFLLLCSRSLGAPPARRRASQRGSR